jgi:hypothetical protein
MRASRGHRGIRQCTRGTSVDRKVRLPEVSRRSRDGVLHTDTQSTSDTARHFTGSVHALQTSLVIHTLLVLYWPSQPLLKLLVSN